RAVKTGENLDKVERDLKIIKTMIVQICKDRGLEFKDVDRINKDGYNDTVADALDDFLEDVKVKAEKEQYRASEEKDDIYARLVKELGSRTAVRKLQSDNQNKRLEEMLLNKNEVEKVLVTASGRLVQQKDPAYHITRFTNGRAHFYSPVKRLGPLEIGTFAFNMVFIWITTVILYFALKFTLLKKLLDKISGFQFSLKLKADKKQVAAQK
ncbi:MAG: hypothetical protein VZQ51_02110, partial [Bacteroidales bacterium]|nr:hypothetical protein [Bacteroidales bacterium]